MVKFIANFWKWLTTRIVPVSPVQSDEPDAPIFIRVWSTNGIGLCWSPVTGESTGITFLDRAIVESYGLYSEDGKLLLTRTMSRKFLYPGDTLVIESIRLS
jgi:hypothetical protein